MDQQDGEQSFRSSQINSRYVRKYMKPIARSVYTDKKVSRLNGSFNGAINSPGLHIGMNEQTKGQMRFNEQAAMTQTFNISILNNSFHLGDNKTKPNTTYSSNLNQTLSQRGVRAIANESFAPFSVTADSNFNISKVPRMSDLRRERKEEQDESLQNLLRRPKHKQIRLDQLSQQDKLMSAPLTMEDKG